jgi:4-amino-4-deoxy-L-arabinose transferase-like glycosyltransferase
MNFTSVNNKFRNGFFFLLIIAALLIRVYGIFFAKKWYSHDESISYLAASGKQEEFKKAFPYAEKITPASEFQKYYELRGFSDFKNVSRGMALTDNHPPMYWWLLHIAVYFLGVHMYTGLILNLIFSLLLLFATYKLAFAATSNRTLSLLAASIWFISPTVNQIDYEARQYQIFGLMSVIFLYLNMKLHFNEVQGSKTRFYITIFIVTLIGLLSHYYFGIIVFGAMLLYIMKNGINKQTLAYFSVLLASLISFLLCFPEFFLFLKGAGNNFSEFKDPGTSVLKKIYLMTVFSAEFFGYRKIGQILFVLFFLSVLYFLFKKFRTSGNFLFRKENLSNKKYYILYMLLWEVLFTASFFAMQLTPGQAIGEQYYSYIWPLLSICLAFLIFSLDLKRIIVYSLLTIICVSGFFSTINSHYVKEEFPMSWFKKANQSDLFVLNATFRGYLFRLTWFLRPDLAVYAGKFDENKIFAEKRKSVSMFYILDNNESMDRVRELFKSKGYAETIHETDPQSNYHFFTFESTNKMIAHK